MDEINEQTENMKQFQEALSAPIGSAADFDEDELEAEFEELEGAELEEQLLQPVPIHVPQGKQTYSDNLVGDDRRKDRLVVPSHGQDSVLLKRSPSSHSSSSHEGLLERMSDSASRTAASYYSGNEGGARRELGAARNKGTISETSFSEMFKKSNGMKKVAAESSDATEGSKG